MELHDLKEKGESNIKITVNHVMITPTLKIYKLKDTSDPDVLEYTDITPTYPNILTIASGIFNQITITAPNEDCYLVIKFNGYVKFLRIGNPTIRLLLQSSSNDDIPYTLYNFNGAEADSGIMSKLGVSNIHYISPGDTGDYIFTSSISKPYPVHIPYVVTETTGSLSGQIVFQKNKWMLLAVPMSDSKVSDLVAGVESQYGVSGSDIFERFSAYPATNTQIDEFLDFQPGVTPIGVKHNFNLIYTDDGDVSEITGFWCKTKNYDLNSLGAGGVDELITYNWSD